MLRHRSYLVCQTIIVMEMVRYVRKRQRGNDSGSQIGSLRSVKINKIIETNIYMVRRKPTSMIENDNDISLKNKFKDTIGSHRV